MNESDNEAKAIADIDELILLRAETHGTTAADIPIKVKILPTNPRSKDPRLNLHSSMGLRTLMYPDNASRPVTRRVPLTLSDTIINEYGNISPEGSDYVCLAE